MDTMKVLLGTTLGLLVALLVLSFSNLQKDNAAEVSRLREENARLRDEKRVAQAPVQSPGTAPTVVAPAAPTDPAVLKALEELQMKLELTEARNKELAKEVLETATVEVTATSDVPVKKVDSRARAIERARVMGKVQVYEPDTGFITLEIKDAANVVEGAKLGIRRGNGIRGLVEVTMVEGGEAVANPLPKSFGDEIEIQPGDELILPPQF